MYLYQAHRIVPLPDGPLHILPLLLKLETVAAPSAEDALAFLRTLHPEILRPYLAVSIAGENHAVPR